MHYCSIGLLDWTKTCERRRKLQLAAIERPARHLEVTHDGHENVRMTGQAPTKLYSIQQVMNYDVLPMRLGQVHEEAR